jgi:hypothetical protein
VLCLRRRPGRRRGLAAAHGAGAAQSFTLQVTGARYGLAYGCANAAGDNISITVIQATVAETARVTVACGGLATATPVTITGTVSGLIGTQSAQIDVAARRHRGGRRRRPTRSCLPSGTWDLFARRMTAAPVCDRMIRRNAVTVAAGATFNLDFTNGGLRARDARGHVPGRAATRAPSQLVIFRNTPAVARSRLGSPSAAATRDPAAQAAAGDYHSVAGVATRRGTPARVRRIFTPPWTSPPRAADGRHPIRSAGHADTSVRAPRIPAARHPLDRYDHRLTASRDGARATRSWSLQSDARLDRGRRGDGLRRSGSLRRSPAAGLVGLDRGRIDQLAAVLATGATRASASCCAPTRRTAELDGREYKITQRDG